MQPVMLTYAQELNTRWQSILQRPEKKPLEESLIIKGTAYLEECQK